MRHMRHMRHVRFTRRTRCAAAFLITLHPDVRPLRDVLDRSEITLIEGDAVRDEDLRYLDVSGRLVYGDAIAMAAA